MAEEMYTVEEEVTEKQPDGRIFLIASKGSQIPMSQARELGLVKDSKKARPSETKETAPRETAAATTTAQKGRGSRKGSKK